MIKTDIIAALAASGIQADPNATVAELKKLAKDNNVPLNSPGSPVSEQAQPEPLAPEAPIASAPETVPAPAVAAAPAKPLLFLCKVIAKAGLRAAGGRAAHGSVIKLKQAAKEYHVSTGEVKELGTV